MPGQSVVRTIFAAMLLSATVSLAQTTNSPKTTNTPPPASTPRTQPQPEQRGPVFLTGRVRLDDGAEPRESVAIERVCNGHVRRESYTDAHGSFSFQLGQSQVLQEASVDSSDIFRGPRMPGNSMPGGLSGMAMPGQPQGGVSPRDLLGCELRASLPGYLSETIDLTGRQLFDNPDVGTLMLHRIGKVEGTKISMTTLQAPPEAKKAWERARKALAKKRTAEAEKQLEKAVAVYPKFAEALVQLGDIYSNTGRTAEAEKQFHAAIEADPKFVPPYTSLAVLAGERRDWKQMAELSERALALNAYEYPSTYLINAIANYNLHNLNAAEKSARTGRRMDTQYRFPRLDFILANVLMQRQDYAGAAEQLQSFLKHTPEGAEAVAARKMLNDNMQRLAAAPATQPK